MKYLLAYAKARRSFFFWMTFYYNRFVNPLPALFAEIRKQASLGKSQVWTAFLDIAIASENRNYNRCYHRCKLFLEKHKKSNKSDIQAALFIVCVYRLHALYERGFYKEAMDGLDDLWEEHRHYAQKRKIHALFLIITFRWKRCRLLPVFHQTLVWVYYLRACLMGRHKYYELSLKAYGELEKTFADFRGDEFKYWIARSWLDRALVSRDMKDFAKEDYFYDRIIRIHSEDPNVLIQCIVAMAGIFKACSLFSQNYQYDAYSLIDWVMVRTHPPREDYLLEIFISASVTKTLFFVSERKWEANYYLCKQDVKRFSKIPHLYAARIAAASEHDQAAMLMHMWKFQEALPIFEEVARKYRNHDDIVLRHCAAHAEYQVDFITRELKRKIWKPPDPYESPLNHWVLFSEFVNPNLN